MSLAAANVSQNSNFVIINWSDNTSVSYPKIWLRDNCASSFHPTTKERNFDLLSVPAQPEITSLKVLEDGLNIVWKAADNSPAHQSKFTFNWLKNHRPGERNDIANQPLNLWNINCGSKEYGKGGKYRFSARDIASSDDALLQWMRAIMENGLAVVDNIDDDPNASKELALRIGFLRETNFGVVFEVMNKPDPSNSAYTADALPLHTDLPNQELAPGIQFLHCLANEATGGGSVFVDGFAVAEEFRVKDPQAFDTLSTLQVPYRYHDKSCDIVLHRPVICCDREGRIEDIRYSEHLSAVNDLPAEQMVEYYNALRSFMAMTREAERQVVFKLSEGEMLSFDNRRIMHGRESFNPSTGFRHLCGCYVDRGELLSKIRVLSR